MSKKKKKSPRPRQPQYLTLQISTTTDVVAMLLRLVDTGFYGVDVHAAAEELLRERLRQIEASDMRLRRIAEARRAKAEKKA